MLASKFWVHGLLFNIVWFCCVVQQNSALAIAVLALWLVLAPPHKAELAFVAIIAALGIGCDALLSRVDWLTFDNSDLALLPSWMLLLWLGFSRFLYRWLTQINLNWSLSILLFAVLGPVNYGIGERLGAVAIDWMSIWASLLFLTWWLCLIPLGMWVNTLCGNYFETSLPNASVQ